VKTRMYMITMLALTIALVTAGMGTRPVAAQTCTAQLNYPALPTIYDGSSVPIVVPLSVTCSTFYGNQLYATGTLSDITTGVNLGSVNVVLPSVGGSSTAFSGQFGFTLPPTSQGDTAQVSASIYSSQYGNVITTTSITFPVFNQAQPVQVVTTTVTEATNFYPYPAAYQSPYPSSYQSPSYPSTSQHHHLYQLQTRNQSSSNSSILIYVAIAAILAAAIIATVGLVVAGRRQPYYVPMLPPPPR